MRHSTAMPRAARRREPAPPKFLPNAQLRRHRDARGLSQQALADLVGCGQSDIAKMEQGHKKSTIDMMVRIAPHLGVEPKDLMPEGDAPPTHVLLAPQGREPFWFPRQRPGPQNYREGYLPVRSAGRGGEQQMFLQDGPIDWRPKPFALINVLDAYAIYMVGESMLPRFRAGQLLYIDPGRPPTPGYGVVVTKIDNTVMVKEFGRWTPSALELQQYNPEETIEVPIAEVRDVHVIVGIEEP